MKRTLVSAVALAALAASVAIAEDLGASVDRAARADADP